MKVHRILRVSLAFILVSVFTLHNTPVAKAWSIADQTSVSYTGSGWVYNASAPAAYNGSITYSKTTNDAGTFNFTGDRITLVYTKFWNRGYARIEIDGNFIMNLDMYSQYTQWQVSRIFYGLSSGFHTLVVKVSGIKNPSSSDYYIDFDALVVDQPATLAGLPDDTSNLMTFFGNWTFTSAAPSAWFSTFRYTKGNRSGGVYEQRGWLTSPVSRDGVLEEGEQMTVLLATGCTNGEHTLDKLVAGLTLRAKTALSPKDSRT